MTTVKDPSAEMAPRSTWALLTDRTFGVYFVGNLVSNCGTWLQNVAMLVVVYQLTGSTVATGAVSILQFAASLLLAPWAGALSDRVDRRRLLIAGQIISAPAAATLAIWTGLVGVEGLPGPWPIFAAATLIGIGWAISVPTMQALVPALVQPGDLEQAVALNSITFNLARAVGPALGALSLLILGPAGTFGLNAASYVVLVIALLLIRPRHVERESHSGDGSVREGLRYVRSQRPLFVLLVGVTALGFGTDPVNTLTPAMADLLGGGEALVGLLVSAFGIGAALMALGVGAVRRRMALGRMAVIGLAIMSAGLFGFSVSSEVVIADLVIPAVVFAVLSLFLAGVGFLLALTGLTTELQRRVPDRFLGRVMALWAVAFLGSRPAAALVDGALGDTFGPRAAAAVAAALVAAVAAWVAVQRRHLGLGDPDVPLASAETPGRRNAPPPVSG